MGLSVGTLHAASAEFLGELGFLAFGKKLRLAHPFFAFDAATEFQMIIDPSHFLLGPCGNLVEMKKPR